MAQRPAPGPASLRLHQLPYDLTPHLKADGPNVLAVRLNVEQPCSRWYSGAGIFRHVRLTSPIRSTWPTGAPTSPRPRSTADAAVKCRSARRSSNAGTAAADVRLETIVRRSARQADVAKDEAKRHDRRRRPERLRADVPVAGPAALVDRDAAALHGRLARSTSAAALVDRYTTPFGIRTIEFTTDKGFLLNGKHVPLNGVCNHHDLGCLGAAVHRRAIERQLEILKGMGCNAIRTSHNPPAPELLDLCDRMGFLVMDEAFDEWKSGKTPHGYGRFFDEWSERDIVEHAPPRPQPSLRHPVEHRQRDQRARGRQRRRDGQAAGRHLPPRRPDAADDLGLQQSGRGRPHAASPRRWTCSASTTTSAPTGSFKDKYRWSPPKPPRP